MPLRSRSTSSRQSARASAYWPAAARASASWNFELEVVRTFAARAARGLERLPPACCAWSRSVSSALSFSASGSRNPRRSRPRIRAWASSSRPCASAIRARPIWAAGRSGSSDSAALYFASAARGSVSSKPGGLGGDRLGRRGQQPVEPGPDHRLGLHADEGIDHLAVAHAEHRGNRPDAELAATARARGRCRPWPARTGRRTHSPAFPAPDPASGTGRTTSAQKSTTTGTDRDRSITSRWKFSAVASITNEASPSSTSPITKNSLSSPRPKVEEPSSLDARS